MTIVTFLYELKSAIEWAINSKIVFFVVSVGVFIIVLRTVGGFLVRFARDNFIVDRRKRQ